MGFDYKSYWNKRLSGDFGLESVGFLGMGKHFNKWMYKVREINFKRTINKFSIQSHSNVLDIGSGSGFYIYLWKTLNYDVTGVDISERAVMNLKMKYGDSDFYVKDVTEDKLQGHFDVISCFDVLFHIVEDSKLESAIENISQALKNGGLFFFTENFLRTGEKRLEHHVSRSLRYYEVLLKKKGFDILYRAPVFYFMNYPVDSGNQILAKIWQFLLMIVPGREYLGYCLGTFLFVVDSVTTKFAKESPTTEIMVCRKK